MFLNVINRVIAPYIFSEIKTDYRSSESASFLRPHGAVRTFVHFTHVNHLPAPLYQSRLTVHPFVCNKDRSWLRHDVGYGTFAGCRWNRLLPNTDSTCDYTEYAAADSWQGTVRKLGGDDDVTIRCRKKHHVTKHNTKTRPWNCVIKSVMICIPHRTLLWKWNQAG
jgi:hypothetical protein